MRRAVAYIKALDWLRYQRAPGLDLSAEFQAIAFIYQRPPRQVSEDVVARDNALAARDERMQRAEDDEEAETTAP